VKDLVEDGNRVMKGYYWQLDKMTEQIQISNWPWELWWIQIHNNYRDRGTIKYFFWDCFLD